MANTLGLLGLPVQRKSMLEQAKIILEISEGRKPAELATLLDIANGLLRIGAALDILTVQGVHARRRLQQTADTAFWETPQFTLVLSQVVDEAKAELAQVIQPLVTFIDSGTQDDELLAVPDRLREVEGFLSTLSHDRAAKLLAQCNQYIERTFVKENKVPSEDILKALADVLIGLESYLETLAGSPIDAKEILDIIEKRLKILASS
jgi:chemosensory pili system protein ChpA (sensor histidine kinase/response regulator)